MQTLGRYRIDAELGEGAMADVYRAYDPDIGREVAIKALKVEYRSDQEFSARFLREARAAGALHHPNIATVYDVGEADGIPYIAMELVEGNPLDQVLQSQGRIPFERFLGLAIQLCDALAFAHAQGIVHRDVKPSNILLSHDGKTAKLLDFGVARIGGGDGSDERYMARTQAGQVIGTPRYMSPEQALGLPVDNRSDLFSLGAVLYEMVTGKVAFGSSGLATLAIQIAQEKVSPIERAAADCPKGVCQIIEKLLAKKPDQRFSDGAQVAKALAQELSALSNEDTVSSKGLSISVKLPLALVGITLITLLLTISAVLDRQQQILENMATTSGEMVANFVSNNTAVLMADNAGLPPDQQDWAPLQAFVTTAALDQGVRGVIVSDSRGIIRAATDSKRIGQQYAPPIGETKLAGEDGLSVTNATETNDIRFVRPIRYAGADFGSIDLLLPRDALDAAMAKSHNVMLILASIILLIVWAVGYLSGALVAKPLRRLMRSFDAAPERDFAMRISHKRRDEFGMLFDSFNRMAAAAEERVERAPSAPQSLEATRIQTSRRRAA